MYRFSWSSDRPLDLAASVARFTRWGDDPVNRVIGGVYQRVIHHGGRLIPYRVAQLDNGTLEIITADRDDASIVLDDLRYRLAELLPSGPVLELAQNDEVVASLWNRFPGYRPPLDPDPFEQLVGAISAQQVNLTFATQTRARLVERYGAPYPWNGVELRAFPRPATLAAADLTELREMKFSQRKSEYLIGLGAVGHTDLLARLRPLPDDVVIERVTRIRGVGRWTADWLLARGFGRPEAVAAGDLGVRKAVGTIYLRQGRKATEAEVRDVAARWGAAANWTAHLLLEALVGGP